MQAIQNKELFTEVSAEESAIVSGGDSITAQFSPSQTIWALGAYQYTLNTSGNNQVLATSVLLTQWNRAFSSLIKF